MPDFFRVAGEGLPVDAPERRDPYEPPEAYHLAPGQARPLTDAEVVGFRAAAGLTSYVGEKPRSILQNPASDPGGTISVEGKEIPVGRGIDYHTYRRRTSNPQP